MLKFLRIICIWICCVSCLFGRITLPTVAAVPFEYFEDHEQYTYDMDTEQSKAKYDTRLLSEQLVKSDKSSAELYDERPPDSASAYGLDDGQPQQQQKEQPPGEAVADDDMEPHERAASCFKSGHKYTHGQKVHRLDPCEVCLCMDGEIFCWWEKCAKKLETKPKKSAAPKKGGGGGGHRSDYGTASASVNSKLQQKPKQKPKHRGKHAGGGWLFGSVESSQPALPSTTKMAEHQAAHNKQSQQKQRDDGVFYQQTMGFKQIQQKQQQQKHDQQQQKHEQLSEQHNNHNGGSEETAAAGTANNKKQQHPHQQHPQQHPQHHHDAEHEHEPQHRTNKILNFPENLPSLLYYDYKTEEHHYHQHQHHQQHLIHQQQKLLQQQKQRERERGKPNDDDSGGDHKSKLVQDVLQMHNNNNRNKNKGNNKIRAHRPDVDEMAVDVGPGYDDAVGVAADGVSGVSAITDGKQHHIHAGMSTPLSVLSTYGSHGERAASSGNENVYDETEIDSDILPEPPTKKPKSTSTTATNGLPTTTTPLLEAAESSSTPVTGPGTTPTASATATPATPAAAATATWSIMTTSKTTMTTKGPNPTSMAASAQTAPVGRTPSDGNGNGNANVGQEPTFMRGPQQIAVNMQKDEQEKNGSDEDQDAAFHRWLTSTETKINSNYDEVGDMSTDSGGLRATNGNGIKSGRISFQNTTPLNASNDFGKSPLPNSTPANVNQLAFNDYSSEFNGSVVNIDIMLTAGGELQRGRADAPQTEQVQDEESIIVEADLITPPGGGHPGLTKTPTQSPQVNGASNLTLASLAVATALPMATATLTATTRPDWPANLAATVGDPYKLSVESTNSQAYVDAAITTTPGPDRQCNVMGTMYKIGDILPQDTGNCLQCVCIDGSTSDDTPRVTCSPHNCPPLVLPDLFDATGY